MSLLLLFKKRREIPLYSIGELRSDTMALIELISSHVIQNAFEHVTVQEGFPAFDNTFMIPSLSLKHRRSTDRHVEVGTKKYNERRNYELDVIGRTRGESEDLASSVLRLKERTIETRDDRQLYLEKIIPVSRFTNNTPVREKRRYFNLYFNGVNTWATLPDHSNLDTQEFGIDLDLDLESIGTHQTKYIFDKYYLNQPAGENKGYRIFLSRGSGALIFLAFHVGIGTSTVQNAINFSSFIGKRCQISCHYSETFNEGVYTLYSYIYIDGVLKSTVTRSWGASVDKGSEDVTLGMFKTLEGLYENGARFDLYNFRLTSSPLRTYGRNGEYLFVNRADDLAYFSLNEGDNTISYNKFNTIPHNLSINNPRWNNYLEEDKELVRISGISLDIITKSLIDPR